MRLAWCVRRSKAAPPVDAGQRFGRAYPKRITSTVYFPKL